MRLKVPELCRAAESDGHMIHTCVMHTCSGMVASLMRRPGALRGGGEVLPSETRSYLTESN